jgi:hypothetical protein
MHDAGLGKHFAMHNSLLNLLRRRDAGTGYLLSFASVSTGLLALARSGKEKALARHEG